MLQGGWAYAVWHHDALPGTTMPCPPPVPPVPPCASRPYAVQDTLTGKIKESLTEAELDETPLQALALAIAIALPQYLSKLS